MSVPTAFLSIPLLNPAKVLNGLKFPKLQVVHKGCLGPINNIANAAYGGFFYDIILQSAKNASQSWQEERLLWFSPVCLLLFVTFVIVLPVL